MLEKVRQEDFRRRLREDLVKRCRTNPQYSMRSYARALRVQSSFLSKILNGKRAVTLRTVERFASALGLEPREVGYFLGQSDAQEKDALSLNELAQDSFEVIADWYHFAILELFTIEGFRPTPPYISKRLGISRVEAIDAMARLERLGLIERNAKKGFCLRKGENTTTGFRYSSGALQKLQTQVLEMAIQALGEVPLEKRDQSTMTMAIDASLLPEAKERIKEFRRNLCGFLQKNRTADSVYQLTIALYPVTRGESGPGGKT